MAHPTRKEKKDNKPWRRHADYRNNEQDMKCVEYVVNALLHDPDGTFMNPLDPSAGTKKKVNW